MRISKTIFLSFLFAGVAMTAEAADVTLDGWILRPTCDIELNNGVATLNVGTYKSADFVANQQIGEVPLSIALTNCTPDETEMIPGGAMTGHLHVHGNVSDTNRDIFTQHQGDTVGFMLKFNSKAVHEGESMGIPVMLDKDSELELMVGMGSETVNPAPGMYSAPLTITYELH